MIVINNENSSLLLNQRQNANNVDIYFKDFLLALITVEEKYMIWQYGGINDKMCERVFAYELYHQWRKLSEQFNYDNLIINGEILKDGSILHHEHLKEIYPDLLLHEQQNNLNQQILACEIKTLKALEHENGKRKLKQDLIKLGHYVSDLQFKYSVFVQVRDKENYFSNVIIPYLQRYRNEFSNRDKVFYVIKNDDSILYDTLENIIN